MGRIGLVMLVGGAVLAYVGYKDYRLSNKVQPTAQHIKAEDLASNGPGDNAHIVLEDFVFTPNFIYRAKKDNKSNWTKAWVPVVAPTTNDPTDFKIIVISDKFTNESSIKSAQLSQKLTGVVINEIDSLGSEEAKHLKQSYPKADLDKVWIIEHDRTVPTLGMAILKAGGGIALVLGGGAVLLGAARKN